MHIVYTCIYIHILIYSICECKFLLTLQTVKIFVVSFEFEMCVGKTFISLSIDILVHNFGLILSGFFTLITTNLLAFMLSEQ